MNIFTGPQIQSRSFQTQQTQPEALLNSKLLDDQRPSNGLMTISVEEWSIGQQGRIDNMRNAGAGAVNAGSTAPLQGRQRRLGTFCSLARSRYIASDCGFDYPHGTRQHI